MAINFPKFETLDYGNVLGNIEAIKGQRLRNQVLGQQAEEQQNSIAAREKAAQIRRQVEGLPAQIEALEQAGHFEQADQVRQSYVSSMTNTAQMLANLRESIDESNYKDFRSGLIQAGAIDGSMMPVEYDEGWFRKKEREARGAISKLTRRRVVNGVEEEQEIFQQDGQVLEQGPFFETADSRRARTSGAAGGMQAADDNAIRSAVHSSGFFKGTVNPVTNEFALLDDSQTPMYLSLIDAASRLFREKRGAISRNEAVVLAWNSLQTELDIDDATSGRPPRPDRRTRNLPMGINPRDPSDIDN
jgi:hypothetical protein